MSLQSQIINLPFDSYEIFTTNPDFNLNATVNSNLTLLYESKNNSIINVDSNGNIHIVGYGKTIVKIYNDGDNIWQPLEKEVLIEVKRKKQSINFFVIPNKYLGDDNFSLRSFGFATSGLPVKYKPLTPNIADIGENGDVIMYNVGTVAFEAYQEGNFEWEETRIIQEFGISHRHYPFNLSLTANKPNTLIKLNLFKTVDNNYEQINKVSGGLYFGNTKFSLNTGLFLTTGEYIGIINYSNIASGTPESRTLNTFYTFSHNIYNASKKNRFLSFAVNRYGFLDYGLDIIVQGIFVEKNGYKYSSLLALESGIFWSGSFEPNKDQIVFTLPLFYNNKIEDYIEGKLKFTFINKNGIPPSLIQLGAFEESQFFVSEQCPTTIGQAGILPYFPKSLGDDFFNFKQASLNPDKYPRI